MGAASAYPARMERDMSEPRIESLANPLVKSLRALRTPKGRDEQRQFLAEGAWMLAEAEAAGWHPEIILVDGSTVRGAAGAYAGRARRVIETTSEVLAKITGRDNPQPLLAVFADPAPDARDLTRLNAASSPRWLLLEAPRDPGNLGSCIRSADAVGAGGIIIAGDSCDPYAIETVRATMGSIFAVPIYRATLGDACALIRRWSGSTVAATLQASDDYASISYAAPSLLVVGSEAHGLSEEVVAACASRARIPMVGRAESLNLAVAAGLMLYAAERAQR